MARLTASVVNARESFILAWFKSNVLDVGQAQAALKARYGRVMSPKRIYELRQVAKEQLDAEGKAAPLPTRGRPRKVKVAEAVAQSVEENSNGSGSLRDRFLRDRFAVGAVR